MIDKKAEATDECVATSSLTSESCRITWPPAPIHDSNASKGTDQTDSATIDDNLDSTYHLKWIPWSSGKIPIIMQSINGPCPLIATMNVLLLREKIKLPPMLEQITATQLLTYLGECLTDSVPNEIKDDENALLNFEQNIHDAIEILPKLKTGLDVNIRFAGITDFEYTPECIIFDILRIPLYHGWLSDPVLHDAIGSQSYNQLVDYIITNKTSQDPEIQARVLLAEEFLEQTASQLTIFGLQELRNEIKDNEVGILFRNNHFLTLFKRENEIYTLVTDHGYLTEDNIIWETLDNIEGAGRFFDSNFQLAEVTASSKQASAMSNIDEKQKQMLEDYLMALELEKEDTNRQTQQTSNIVVDPSTVERRPSRSGTSISEPGRVCQVSPDDDFELAKRLQDEEYRMFEGMMRNRQSNPDHQSWAMMETTARPAERGPEPLVSSDDRSRSTSAKGNSRDIDRTQSLDLQDDTSFPSLISHQVHDSTDRPPALEHRELMSTHSQSKQYLTDFNCNTESSNTNCAQTNQRQQGSSTSQQQLPTLPSDTSAQTVPIRESIDYSEQMDCHGRHEVNPPSISSAISNQESRVEPITITATATNQTRQPSDRSRQKSERNSKETNCIVH